MGPAINLPRTGETRRPRWTLPSDRVARPCLSRRQLGSQLIVTISIRRHKRIPDVYAFRYGNIRISVRDDESGRRCPLLLLVD